MRILVCSAAYPPHLNGQSVFTANLARGLAQRGNEVAVLTLADSQAGQPSSGAAVKIIRVRSLHLPGLPPELRIPFLPPGFLPRLFDQLQPELIHIQDPSPLCRAVVREARRRQIPAAATHHPGPEIAAPYLRLKNPMIKRFLYGLGWRYLRMHLNQADLVATPSRFMASLLQSRGVQAPVEAIACGVNLEDFRPCPGMDPLLVRRQLGLDPAKKLLIYVGRLDYEKNLESLLGAMARLGRPDVQLAIAGMGAQGADLRRLADATCGEGQVVFLGEICHAALPGLINAADAFVMPGGAESFSIATLEAMACAKPILAARAAALPELVSHQVNGYLFQPGDCEELAAAIQRLADEDSLRARMGALSLAKARRLSVDRMAQAYENAYRRVCREKSPPADWREPAPRRLAAPTRPLRRHGSSIPARLAGVLAALVLLFCSAAFYDQVQARPNLRPTDLALLEVQAGQRLLVIAPHPDDEVLAAGGLMQKILEGGGQVEVAVVTNGDGQQFGPLLEHPFSSLKSEDYIGFGKKRQMETAAALRQVGVPRDQVVFLGYPDGRLGYLWSENWPDAAPVAAPYTRALASPYLNTYNPGASYRGGDLFDDLLRIIQAYQPDLIAVPHPEDANADHAAVSDFARFAIASYLADGDRPAPRVLTYLVHYEGYPIPRGNGGKYLLPPAALANAGKGWLSSPLTAQELNQKTRALNAHRTQLRSGGSYLRSFLRSNEIFYDLPSVRMALADYEDDALLEWDMQAGFDYGEPARERASRLLFSGADLVGWRAARLGRKVCFGAETRGPASPYFSYVILAKLPDGENLRIAKADDLAWYTDRTFGACFDLDELGDPAAIGFAAETRNRALVVDRTAWRFIYFPY